MNRQEKILAISILEEKARRKKERKLFELYPTSGPLRRELYHKHTEFFEAGRTFLERGAIAGNRTGKTTMSCFETTLHLTGIYPEWWKGKRFDGPVDWWAASDTGETTRDILQLELMGKKGEFGTGMIPKDSLYGDPTARRGIPDALDTVRVKHSSGGISTLGFKSYDQGREKFQGTKKHGVSLDEEPPMDVYFECLTRVMATSPNEQDGTMICTFTPLNGMSAVVLMYLNESSPTRFVLTMGMNHVPHLSDESKAKFLATFPIHEREARMDGTPQLGSGAIYPIPEADVVVDDFEIPDHWPRGYGMDVGWNKTSAGFWALDRESDILYRYSDHYRGQAEPAVHAQAIQARGDWLKGVIDPASRGRSQKDGQQLLQIYLDLGLDLETAFNGVESGIFEVWQRMSSGRLKVFKSCQSWLSEFRLYRRDEKGKIVKEFDHAMDETRYFVMSGIPRMITKPVKKSEENYGSRGSYGGWIG